MTDPFAKYDRELLGYKVRWEGGVVSALEYGIHSDDIADPELAALWAHLEALYAEMRPLIVEVGRLIRAPDSIAEPDR